MCGLKEIHESAAGVRKKVLRLAALLRQHKGKVWCCTGAGISTSAGLPDFRGPHGIWTKQQQDSGKLKSPKGGGGKAAPRLASSFGAVKPSFTHHALTALVTSGYINHIATQNVDGLHRRADAPLEKLSELHGNVCLEVCVECKAEYHRADDVGGVGLQLTGSHCVAAGCNGALRDHVLDWDDELPKDHVRRTERRARKATLSIALGTSLRIKPVGDMPLLALGWEWPDEDDSDDDDGVDYGDESSDEDTNGKEPSEEDGGIVREMVIVNLQRTPLDKHCTLRFHVECDAMMRMLMEDLNLEVKEPEAET